MFLFYLTLIGPGGGGIYPHPSIFSIYSVFHQKLCTDFLWLLIFLVLMSNREKKNPEKSFWGGFYRWFVARKSVTGCTRLTWKTRVSATKIKILRKTEHMSKIMVCWGCLPIFWRSNHIWRQEPQKTKKGHFRQRVGRPSICRGILLYFGTKSCPR